MFPVGARDRGVVAVVTKSPQLGRLLEVSANFFSLGDAQPLGISRSTLRVLSSLLPIVTEGPEKSSDDRPLCLENPRPAGADSTLTENVASPFEAEPPHFPAQKDSCPLSRTPRFSPSLYQRAWVGGAVTVVTVECEDIDGGHFA